LPPKETIIFATHWKGKESDKHAVRFFEERNGQLRVMNPRIGDYDDLDAKWIIWYLQVFYRLTSRPPLRLQLSLQSRSGLAPPPPQIARAAARNPPRARDSSRPISLTVSRERMLQMNKLPTLAAVETLRNSDLGLRGNLIYFANPNELEFASRKRFRR
jgi:hypothetical protein